MYKKPAYTIIKHAVLLWSNDFLLQIKMNVWRTKGIVKRSVSTLWDPIIASVARGWSYWMTATTAQVSLPSLKIVSPLQVTIKLKVHVVTTVHVLALYIYWYISNLMVVIPMKVTIPNLMVVTPFQVTLPDSMIVTRVHFQVTLPYPMVTTFLQVKLSN